MNAKLIADWQTYHAMSAFFDEESDIVNGSEILKEDVEAFMALVDAIRAKMDEVNAAPPVTGADRKELKVNLAKTASNLLFKLKAHAVKTSNQDLLQFCKPALSTITQMPEEEFITFVRQVTEKLTTHAIVLQKYNVTEEQRTAFSASVTKYTGLMPQIKVVSSKASVNNDNLVDLFKQTKAFVSDVLMAAVDSVSDTQPNFVKAFQDVKTGRTPSVSATQLAVKVMDAESNAPIFNAKVEVPTLNFIGTTDENGKCIVKVGSKQELDVVISKNDWQTQSIKVEKFTKGRIKEVEVALESMLVVA